MNLRVFYVDGAQTSRQINTLSHRLQTLSSHPPKPFSGCHAACIPCTKHNDVAVMPGAAAAGVPPASSPAHPAVSFARRGHAAHHLIGLAGPAPIRPKGAPPCSIVLQSRHSPSLRNGTVTALGFRSLSSFAPVIGRPRFARKPRSRPHFPSPPACRTFSLSSLRPVPADFAVLRLPWPGVIAAFAVTRTALRPEQDTAPGGFSCWCSGRQQTRAAL